jgi:hypothetical protein
MYTLESNSLLQLLNSTSDTPEKSPRPSTGSSVYDSLIQVILREGLDRIDGDFLEIGGILGGGNAKLASLAASTGKRVWAIPQDSRKPVLPPGTRLAFAFVDGNHDPIGAKDDFRLAWNHLVPGGWAAFHEYAGDFPEVTIALNAMLTEYSSEIDRVERIKDQRVLLIRKRRKSGKP